MSKCEIGLFIEDQHLGFEVEFNYTEHDDRIEVLSIEAQTQDGNKSADFLRFTNKASIEEAIRAEQYDGC